MKTVQKSAIKDATIAHYLEGKLGNQSLIIYGDDGADKTELCRQLIESRRDLIFKFVDPYGEIFDGLALGNGPNYDIYDPDLFDKSAAVFINNCQSNDASRVFEIMKYSGGVLTTFHASRFDEALQCLILRAKFEDSSRTIDDWKNYLAVIKPLFIQLSLREKEYYISDIVEYSGQVKHIHPI